MVRKALLALALALALPFPGAAQKATPGQVAYVEGVRAFDSGDYATAARRMRVALAEDPGEATARFRYRAQNAEDYFPHLWLGLSLEKLGEREESLEELRESRRQGAVAARPALERILSAALARVTPPTPAPTAPPAAAPSPVPPSPAVAEAAPVATPPGPTSTPRPEAPRVAERPSPAAPAVSARGGNSAPNLRAGLRAFFRGDYAATERLLAPVAGESPVARAFMAWSLGARYLLSEPRDPELLARARREYAAALLAGGPTTGGPWVSPAILELFGATDGRR